MGLWYLMCGGTVPRRVVDGAVRVVRVFGTGHPIQEDATWLYSWQSPPFVWHLYRL